MLVNEIFASIDGEVNKWHQGIPTVFVRLQGCNLRCSYCDTPNALDTKQEGARFMTTEKIIQEVNKYGLKKVTITGGEPLFQEPKRAVKALYPAAVFELIDELMRLEYVITIETNGTYNIPTYYTLLDDVSWVVDYKWEYEEKMVVDYRGLAPTDWIKFVIPKKYTMKTFNKIKQMRKEGVSARIAVSSSTGNHRWLMKQLIGCKMYDVVLNVQLHKLIGVA